jgi:hypothetical protein
MQEKTPLLISAWRALPHTISGPEEDGGKFEIEFTDLAQTH